MSPQGAVLARFNATMAYAHVGAIASALDAETLAAGPGGQLWFSWGPYPVGVGYLDSKPSVPYPEWESGSEPQAMVLGADGRLWLSFTGAAANSSTGNYGFVDAANLTETAYTARQQVFGLTNGPGLDVSYVSMDNYLYEIATSVSAATASAGPSSIALSLPTPAQAFSKMVVVAASAVIAVGGVLFITFPANLFNLPFDENYEAIATWVARRRRRIRQLLQRPDQPAIARTLAPTSRTHASSSEPGTSTLPMFIAVLDAGALFGSVLDPRFGLNVTTIESFCGVAVATVAGIAIRGVVACVYHRQRARRSPARLRALPLGLVIAATCVAVSRLSGFQPGYLYGIVCAVTFGRRLSTRAEGQLAGLITAAIIATSVIAWLLWLPINPGAQQPGAFAGVVVLDDFLASMFTGGLVGTMIGLLPLRFLPGYSLKEWSTPVWAITFAVALFAVFDILVLSSTSSGSNRAPLLTTFLLFVVVAALTILFREYFSRRWRAAHGVVVRGFRAHLYELLTSHPRP